MKGKVKRGFKGISKRELAIVISLGKNCLPKT